MRWQFFAPYRPSFAAAFLVSWNAAMALGIWLNDGMGEIHRPAAFVVCGLATLSIPVILFAATVHPKVRELVFRPDTNLAEINSDLFVLGSVAGLMGIVMLTTAALSNAP
jgi:hypothetical protein